MNADDKIKTGLAIFDINEAFNLILDPKVPLPVRAVKLFELQVAITSCKRLNAGRVKPNSFSIDVNREIITSARTLASVKVLENAFSKIPSEHKNTIGCLARIFVDEGLSSLVEYLFLHGDGLMKVRYAIRPLVFDKELESSIAQAASVACLYDISLMFEKIPSRPRTKGGVTFALQRLEYDYENNEPAYYQLDRKIDSIKKNQQRLAPVGALLWLGLFQSKALQPLPIRKTSFTKRLLRAASNLEDLRKIAIDCGKVRSRLIERGYSLPDLQLKKDLPPSTIKFKPMPEELLYGVE